MAKKSKMIICKHCGQEIAASAKTCPHCGGKNKKPFYKKAWFWILVIIVAIAAVAGSGNDDEKKENKKIGEVSSQEQETKENGKESQADNAAGKETEKAENESTVPETEADAQTVYHVGDILHDGNMDIVYIASGEYKEDNEFMQPEEGKKYIFLKFAFINTSDKSDTSVSSYSFEGYADGYTVDSYYGGEEDLSATLSAGRSTLGYVYFEVPTDAKEIEVEYETNFFTEDKITFVYEEGKDSGYELPKNTTATPDALQVGDTLEGKTLNITYLSCFNDTSDNMFITPREGYHYVTCEIEFENVSDSDQSVSYFSFDCFADGISCNGAYFRDDNISAEMSPGRKAKGTVTFEVPDDAAVIEVEYETSFWTSNRVVFNALVR